MTVSVRILVMGACAVAGLAAVLIWSGIDQEPVPDEATDSMSYPELFSSPPSCSSAKRASTLADRMARRGRMAAERYPYDPGDGIRAVSHLREAEDCYRLSGQTARAHQVGQLGSSLVSRINADYASARLTLDNALMLQRWSVAREEARRLLALTEHLGPNGYVEWLRGVSGKVATLADESP